MGNGPWRIPCYLHYYTIFMLFNYHVLRAFVFSRDIVIEMEVGNIHLKHIIRAPFSLGSLHLPVRNVFLVWWNLPLSIAKLMADDFISSATSNETMLLHVKRDRTMYLVTACSTSLSWTGLLSIEWNKPAHWHSKRKMLDINRQCKDLIWFVQQSSKCVVSNLLLR